MQLSILNTKSGKCDACKEQDKLKKINIKGFEFFLCSDCIIGHKDSTPEENEEFLNHKRKIRTVNR